MANPITTAERRLLVTVGVLAIILATLGIRGIVNGRLDYDLVVGAGGPPVRETSGQAALVGAGHVFVALLLVAGMIWWRRWGRD